MVSSRFRETLPQEIRWRATGEDTWHGPLTSACRCTSPVHSYERYAYTHHTLTHTHIQQKKTQFNDITLCCTRPPNLKQSAVRLKETWFLSSLGVLSQLCRVYMVVMNKRFPVTGPRAERLVPTWILGCYRNFRERTYLEELGYCMRAFEVYTWSLVTFPSLCFLFTI